MPEPILEPQPEPVNVPAPAVRNGTQISDLPKIAVLLGYWKYRDKIHRWARYGATGILFLTALGFFVEYVAHLAGESVVFVPRQGLASTIFQWSVIVFLVYLTWDHWTEAQKPGYEYAFVKSLCDFTAKYQSAHKQGQPMRLMEALSKFHPLFTRLKVDRLAVYLEHNGQLQVAAHHIYRPMPQQVDRERYFPQLAVGEGLGGGVYQDSWTRYMPWCGTPKRPFLHALKFDFSQGIAPNNDIVAFNTFKIWQNEIPFRSLLCVPLGSASKNYGFLQMTFSKSNRLDMSDVTMAVVLGLVLGQALDSLDLTSTAQTFAMPAGFNPGGTQ